MLCVISSDVKISSCPSSICLNLGRINTGAIKTLFTRPFPISLTERQGDSGNLFENSHFLFYFLTLFGATRGTEISPLNEHLSLSYYESVTVLDFIPVYNLKSWFHANSSQFNSFFHTSTWILTYTKSNRTSLIKFL